LFCTVFSASMQGLQAAMVRIEADISEGLPSFQLVGYLSSEVKEAGERVRTAIRNSGFHLPAKRIVVNLSPANIRKRGTIFDLGISIAILAVLNQLEERKLEGTLFAGELSLDGSIKRASGILSIVMEAKKQGCKRCIIPRENRREGELVEGIEVLAVSNLKEAYEIINGVRSYEREYEEPRVNKKQAEQMPDFADIKGQRAVKRAVEIAVAGSHNMLMIGKYGAGKTAIAKRIPTILPPLTLEESLQLTEIYSSIGEVDDTFPLMSVRPFREVNATVTKSTLLGGGVYPKPGEISLAHKGVLFLDETAEFPRHVLESLRRPLEDRMIRIVRERGEFEFPADFLLVAAMNPCPCGHYPDLNKCNCTTSQIQKYLGRLSQPFLDRIDICVEVEKVQYTDLTNAEKGETSKEIRERVLCTRKIQAERYRKLNITTNAQLGMTEMDEYCALNSEQKKMMEQAYEQLELSARSYHKVLSVARTIADMEESEQIKDRHLREALGYRVITRKYRRGLL